MDYFCAIYHLKSLIKEPTGYKNPEKPIYVDLILANSPRQSYTNIRDWFIRL